MGVNILNILRDDERQLADIHDDLGDIRDLISLRQRRLRSSPWSGRRLSRACRRALTVLRSFFTNELGKRRRSVSRRAEQRLEVRCAGIVGDLLQTDRVKLALGGADAAADAETFVYNCRAAVQTAARLGFQLLFGECSAEIAERFLRGAPRAEPPEAFSARGAVSKPSMATPAVAGFIAL